MLAFVMIIARIPNAVHIGHRVKLHVKARLVHLVILFNRKHALSMLLPVAPTVALIINHCTCVRFTEIELKRTNKCKSTGLIARDPANLT